MAKNKVQKKEDLMKERKIRKFSFSIFVLLFFYFLSASPLTLFANENPEILNKLLRALIKAEKFIHENRDESIKITADVIGMDKDALDDIWDNYSFKIKLDQSLLEYMQKQGQWAIDSRIVNQNTKQTDFRSLIHTQPLLVLNKNSVTLKYKE